MISRSNFTESHKEAITETVHTLQKTVDYHLSEHGYYHSDIKTSKNFGVDIAAIGIVKIELENAGWSCDIQLNHNTQEILVRVY